MEHKMRIHALLGSDYNSLYAGLGAKGYDVVAYFTEGYPVQGNADHTHEHGGVTWRFASAHNRDLFVAEPAKYAPQYGGFCAWGVAQGRLFDVDPVNGWKVLDGKLFLNFNADIRAAWEKDVSGFITKADANWPKFNG
jgi:YHS domain-containing protein